MFVIAACDAQAGKLTIRSTGTPLPSSQPMQVSSRVADGRAQLALGNVALALETFRRAVREQPGNADALTGLAMSYDRMGRHDVSRRHFEAALAVEPANERTLAAFASSLDLQGKADEAASVRSEIGQRLLAARTVSLPASIAPSAPEAESAAGFEEPAKTMMSEHGRRDRPPSAAQANVNLPVQPAPRVVAAVRGAPAVVASAPRDGTKNFPTAPAGQITIALPPPRPVVPAEAKKAAVAGSQRSPAAVPVATTTWHFESGPRLERTSMAEVTLVTRRVEPMPRGRGIRQAAESASVRYVPLRQAGDRVAVRVLNAARVDRLAANTRRLMAQRGWKNVVIGNAAAVRARSIVLYPAHFRAAAQRLALQLGFRSAARAGTGGVTVLLGSDAAALVKRRAAS
jgi:hypothetical protein